MPFQGAMVVRTLWAVADALRDSWAQTDGETRQALEQLLRAHGPELARSDHFGFPYRAAGLLAALWEMREHLPSVVTSLLADGASGRMERSGDLPERVDEDTRAAVLQRLLLLADFRVYRRPQQLAAKISRYVADHLDRLTDAEIEAWQGLDQELRSGGPAETYLSEVEGLLAPTVGSIRRLLDDGKGWETERLRDASIRGPAASGPATDHHAAELRRYANLYIPGAVLLSQKSIPLVVHIARQFLPDESRVAKRDALVQLRRGDLTVIVIAEDLVVTDAIGGRTVPGVPNGRLLSIDEEQECEPLVFFLDPLSAGRKRISVGLYQFDRLMAAINVETVILNEPNSFCLPKAQAEPFPLVSPGPEAQPPELELRVTLSHDGRTLAYMLHSPSGGDYTFKPAGQVTLQCDPEELLSRTLGRLSDLAGVSSLQRSADQAQRTIQELRDIGANLYTELFSADMKAEYRAIRRRYRGRSLMITTDDPWIPWELVRPVEVDSAGRIVYDDAPLCETFHLSRWLAGRGAPDTAAVRNLVLVLPPSNLQAAQEEANFFAGLHRQCWDLRVDDPLTTLSAVEDRFRSGSVHLIHFACHGNFESSDADESKLRLADGYLRPSQIIGDKQAGLRRARPIVFLNACHSGRVGFAMTKLGGWAQRFLDSGASAFVGSLWEISDELAALFARTFYQQLLGCDGSPALPFAEAFHGARMAVKKADPANPTWLAFVLYADPLGRVRLGQSA